MAEKGMPTLAALYLIHMIEIVEGNQLFCAWYFSMASPISRKRSLS